MLKRLLTLSVLLAALFALAVPMLAQESPTLAPFTDEAFGIQGVIPEGWTKAGPGLYARGSTPTDVALVALQSAPVTLEDLMQALLPQFGLDAAPESIGTTETPAFDWNLYQFDVTDAGVTVRVDLALAEQDGSTYVALLQSAPDEYDALHTQLFQPLLESFSKLESSDEPLPYQVEDVTFDNGEITLAGTLTLPDSPGPHPAVALMTGSAPQDRNEMVIPGFPIFQQIADYLTRQGIAVLRYDDRGVGQSTGDYNQATIAELASDGQAAVAYLRARAEINPDQVGVLGHSEGGIYAAILGADPDSGIAFSISLAGTAVDGKSLILHQNEAVLRAGGASQAVIDSQIAYLNESFPLVAARDWDALEQAMIDMIHDQWALLTDAEREALGGDVDAYANQTASSFRQTYASEWYATVLEYNPADDWAKTTVPVLAIFGALDVQVDEVQNAAPLAEALVQAGNQDFSIVVLPDANHLFQVAETGAIQEYAILPPEFTPALLPTISAWLLQHVEISQ